MILSVIAGVIFVSLAVLGGFVSTYSIPKGQRRNRRRTLVAFSALGCAGLVVVFLQALQEDRSQRDLKASISGDGSPMITIGPVRATAPPGYPITVGNSGAYNLYEVNLRIQELRSVDDRTLGRITQQVDVVRGSIGTLHPHSWQMTDLRLDVPKAGGRYLVDFADKSGQTHGELNCTRRGAVMDCVPTMEQRIHY